jgi:hypothetical protein
LVKNKNAELDFTADHLIVGKIKETGIKELSATSISDELLTTYETLKPKEEKSPLSKKFFLAFLAVTTIAAIIWVGYKLNQPNSSVQKETAQEMAPAITDTAKNVSSVDTTTTIKQPLVKTSNGSYRLYSS